MARQIHLTAGQCGGAAAIQQAIDSLGPAGGRVALPDVTLTLDRGLELRSGVELTGQGARTVLRKGPGRVYALAGYHNYGMCDVPLEDSAGLVPGMTVSVLDDVRGGFYSTFARITWVDGNWVGLDRGIEADLKAQDHPRLTTAHPLIFGHGIHNAAIRDLALDGNREENAVAMDGCRGGCVYFCRCRDIEMEGVRERNYAGEGLSFQMCARMRIRSSSFGGNTGNGLHPGAGSTGALFENCAGEGNGRAGFYFCVRANHITVRTCTFRKNAGNGISIGTRDSFNLMESCRIVENAKSGIEFRPCGGGTDARCCVIRGCRIAGNGTAAGEPQIAIAQDARDLILEANEIACGADAVTAGIRAGPAIENVFLYGNIFENCRPDTEGACFVTARPDFRCGHESVEPSHYRHLPEGCS